MAAVRGAEREHGEQEAALHEQRESVARRPELVDGRELGERPHDSRRRQDDDGGDRDAAEAPRELGRDEERGNAADPRRRRRDMEQVGRRLEPRASGIECVAT